MLNFSNPVFIDREKQANTVFLTLSLAVVLYACRALIFADIFFPSIIWNIFLAFIPWGISLSISGKGSRFWRWVKGLVWLLFLPNSFYIATDLVHLNESTPQTFWIDLVVLMSFTASAFLMGFYSFNNIEKVFNREGRASRKIMVRSALFLACSYGLFMGRVLRWNSWDLFVRPVAVLESVVESIAEMKMQSLSFTISFSFFVFLYLIYHLFFIANKTQSVHDKVD